MARLGLFDMMTKVNVSLVRGALKKIGFHCTARNRCGKVYFTVRHNGWEKDRERVMCVIRNLFPKAHVTSCGYFAGSTATIASA